MTASPSQCQPNPLDELCKAKAALSMLSLMLTQCRDFPNPDSRRGGDMMYGLGVIFDDIEERMDRAYDIFSAQHQENRRAAMPPGSGDNGMIYPRLDTAPEAEAVPPLAATA